jgi:UDP-N-acetylglucosamine 2-epimerase
MKIITVVGARPQFIKAAPVSKALRKVFDEKIIHTGQHYDKNMSDVFFGEMQIPRPDYNLNVGSGTQGYQTAKMLEGIEEILIQEKPDCVLVYGDTNSTIAAALAACKLHIKIAHVEAGLRSFNRSMPEEHNRVLTDHCSDFLFCPTSVAEVHLKNEGITHGVHVVGDVMFDAALMFEKLSSDKSVILKTHGLNEKDFYLATIHRPYNTDDESRMIEIFTTFSNLKKKVIFPAHPRTKKIMEASKELKGFLNNKNICIIEPVGYLDMIKLQKACIALITDSGGMQKEAYFHAIPCITLRSETEWVETVESGWNTLVWDNAEKMTMAISEAKDGSESRDVYGDGNAAGKIADILRAGS